MAQSGSVSARFVPLSRSRRPCAKRRNSLVMPSILPDKPHSDLSFCRGTKRGPMPRHPKRPHFVIQTSRSRQTSSPHNRPNSTTTSKPPDIASATTGSARSWPKDTDRRRMCSKPPLTPVSPRTRSGGPSPASGRLPGERVSTRMRSGAGGYPAARFPDGLVRRLHDEASGSFEECTANGTFPSKNARRTGRFLRRMHGERDVSFEECT